MEQKHIVITISPSGQIKVRAEGYQGPSCVDDVRRFAEALGIALEEQHLPEYYLFGHADEEADVTAGG